MRDPFKYNAYFPSNIEKSSESEINFSEIVDAFIKVNWSIAFEKASLLYDHPEVKQEFEMPFFQVMNLENKHKLSFIVARNDALENIILMFFSYPEEKVSFFGWIKKEVEGGMSAIVKNEDAIEILKAFERKNYKFIESFDEHKHLR